MVKRRNWKKFNQILFILRFKESELCSPTALDKTASELAERYSCAIVQILDELVPMTERTVCVRPGCPFYGTTMSVDRRVEQCDVLSGPIEGLKVRLMGDDAQVSDFHS